MNQVISVFQKIDELDTYKEDWYGRFLNLSGNQLKLYYKVLEIYGIIVRIISFKKK